MKTLFTTVFCMIIGLGLVAAEAEAAKRLGGGGNAGRQRDSVTQQRATPQQTPSTPSQAQQAAPRPAPAAAPAPSGASRWLGPLAGLAVGGLLASMFMGGGFEGIKFMDIMMILLLAGGAFFVIAMLRRKAQPQQAEREPMRYAGAAETLPRSEPQPSAPVYTSGAVASPAPLARTFPAGFDAAAFAGHAKQNFVRLQAANDAKDASLLRDFMTAELFAEISAQINARGDVPQKTEVVTLEAEVLEVVTEGPTYVASVRFNGLIKEASDAQPESFSEVWHLEKPVSGKSGWLISGIQQA